MAHTADPLGIELVLKCYQRPADAVRFSPWSDGTVFIAMGEEGDQVSVELATPDVARLRAFLADEVPRASGEVAAETSDALAALRRIDAAVRDLTMPYTVAVALAADIQCAYDALSKP